MAALINASILIAISMYLFKEAYVKFLHPDPIKGSIVIWVALVGFVANIVSAILLQKGSEGDINVKSSYLHLLSDALSSIAVILGGIAIYYLNIYWVDPLITVLIGIYVVKGSFGIVRKVINILMQGVPEELDVGEAIKDIQKIDGIIDVHHVHVWSLDESHINFEAHVNICDMLVSETKKILEEIEHALLHRKINHVTIQFEHECCRNIEGIASQFR